MLVISSSPYLPPDCGFFFGGGECPEYRDEEAEEGGPPTLMPLLFLCRPFTKSSLSYARAACRVYGQDEGVLVWSGG